MTSMRPAYEVTLTHGSDAVILRASLRAACNLDNLPGGLADTLDRIGGQNFTTIKAAIRATATDTMAADRLLNSLEGQPLKHFTQRAQAAILDLIEHLLPASDDAATASPDAPAMPWGDHFKDLYGFGTGWLGWTPETTWNASIQEITTALDAHVKRLVAMNGGAEDDQPARSKSPNIYTKEQLQQIEELGFDPAFDRQGLAQLKALTA